MKCGNCKLDHPAVTDVRACYAQAGKLTATQPAPDRSMSPVERIRAAAAKLPNEETMRYAIQRVVALGEFAGMAQHDWKFYRVNRPTEGKWKGYTFVRVQAGDETFPIRNLAEVASVLEAIALDPKQAALNYGLQLRHCSNCGKRLTNPESIAAGIGPICANKLNW